MLGRHYKARLPSHRRPVCSTSHAAGSYSGSHLVRDECSCLEYAQGSLLCHTWLSAQWVSLHWLEMTQLLANTRAPFKNKYSSTEENKGPTQSLCARSVDRQPLEAARWVMELDDVEFSPAWVPGPTFLKGGASRVPGSVSLRQKEKGQSSQAASRFLMRSRIWCAGFARSNLTLCSLQNAVRPEESKAPCWCPGCEECAPHTKYALLFACLERSPET